MVKPEARAAYSREAWIYIGAVVALGLGFEAGLLGERWSRAWTSGGWSIAVAALILVLASVAGRFPVKVDRSQKLNLGSAVVFAAVLLYPPPFAAAMSGAAVAVYSVALRRPWYNVVFSIGQHLLNAGLAGVVYAALWTTGLPPLATPRAALAVAVAAVVYAIVAVLIVSGVVSLTQGRPLPGCVVSLLRQSVPQYLALTGAGALVVVCIWQAPWAVPIPALSLPLIQQLNRRLEELAAAKEELDRVLARQRRFVADVAHEVGTPLTTLAGNVEVLRQGGADDPSELQEILQDLGAEFRRLSALFGHLMLLAQADEHDAPARRPVRLDLVMAEVADARRQDALRADLTLSVGELNEVWVQGDERRLRQMMAELLENATRYTPAGGRIGLEIKQTAGEARIVVANSGPGIAPEDLPHVFERFYRGQTAELRARSRGAGGSGLGLAIVKSVAEMHGGGVVAESQTGQGASFTVRLPAGARPGLRTADA